MAQSRSEAILENMLGASNVVDPKTRLEKLLVQVGDKVDQAGSYGSPLQAATVAAMTDKTRVYVYTGTESGYTAGNWYYWNGTAWTSGGTYNAVAVDSALNSTSENPVQNKVINAGINSLKEELTQLEADTYASWRNSHDVTYNTITWENNEMGLNGTVGGSSSYKHSNKVAVSEGDVVYLYSDNIGRSDFVNHGYVMRFVTAFADDTAVSASGGNSVYSYTVPSGINYVVVSVYASHLSAVTDFKIAVDTAVTEEIPKDSTNILNGKKWVACGDSFTQTGYSLSDGIPLNEYVYTTGRMWGEYITYPQIIGLRNNMTIVNLAVSGMSMTDINGTTANSFTHGTTPVYTTIPSDADYITIKLGINDLNSSATLGTIDDTDITTFYGAWNTALAYIVENYPFAKVGIIVPNGTSGNTTYIDAIIAVAEKWGVPYLDEYYDTKVPLLHRVNRPDVTDDVLTWKLEAFRVSSSNTHPNTDAQYYEASFIEDWLKRL